MKKYHFISDDRHVDDYVLRMISWMERNTDTSEEVIKELFLENKEQIHSLFSPLPETIFHDEPGKWAELLATNWGLLEEKELEFV